MKYNIDDGKTHNEVLYFGDNLLSLKIAMGGEFQDKDPSMITIQARTRRIFNKKNLHDALSNQLIS